MAEVEDAIRLFRKIVEREDRKGESTLYSFLYDPPPPLGGKIDRLVEYSKKKRPSRAERRKAGDLLEQIAYLAFSGLQGLNNLRSFQSAGPQYDLLFEGDGSGWKVILEACFSGNYSRRDFLIECKATRSSVSDKDVSRVANIMRLHLTTVGVGVFFSLRGISTGSARSGLAVGRLRQVLVRAQTGCSIVGLDLQDIKELSNKGALISIIVNKVRELATLQRTTEEVQACNEVPLPVHLHEVAQET